MIVTMLLAIKGVVCKVVASGFTFHRICRKKEKNEIQQQKVNFLRTPEVKPMAF